MAKTEPRYSAHIHSSPLSNLTILTRILLIAAIPTLSLVGHVYWTIQADWNNRASLSQTLKTVTVTSAIGDLVTTLQREAGVSAMFAVSRGKEMRSELTTARAATNASIKKLTDAVSASDFKAEGGNAARAYLAAEANLNQIEAKRAAVDSQTLAVNDLNEFYTFGLIGKLLDATSQTLPLIRRGNLPVFAQTYESIVWLKEMSGATRANAVAGFSTGHFDSDLRMQLKSFLDRQNLYKARFQTYASPEELSFYRRTVRA
ncbi:nitrate- and nitrite sensing domain-containing protein [Telmatospirillum siberiense]|nr:nitrate- and nitrite sensing domain-containing protein [Telmatospirillum siberiense]